MTLHQDEDGRWRWTCHYCSMGGTGFGLQHGALFAAVAHINEAHPDVGEDDGS